VQRYLAVRTGAQAMARAFEWSLNSFVAVELAIDDDPDFVVFACNWLIAGLEVDDAEPRMTKGNSTIRADPMALTVRPAVMEALGGTLNEVCRDWITTREKRDDPAHMLSSPFGPVLRRCVTPDHHARQSSSKSSDVAAQDCAS